MEGHTEWVLQTNGGGPYQIEFDKLLLTTGATMSRSFANGDDATDKVSPQPVMPARATEQPKSTASSPLKSNLELLSSTPLISSTFAATANNQEGGGGDVQTTCSTTRKALGDFHIRSRPPSPTSKSSRPSVPSSLKEATDEAAIARRRSSSSRSPKAELKRNSPIFGARPHPHNRSHRENFLIFTRILFKCLSDHPSAKVRVEAKQIIVDCTKRNRLGEPGFHPLINAIEVRLRHVIGDIHWHRAEQYLGHYMTFRRKGGADANALMMGGTKIQL